MWTVGRLENWKQLMSVDMFSNPRIDDLFYDLWHEAEIWNAEDIGHSQLCSAAHGDLQVPRSKNIFRNRALADECRVCR